MEDGPRYEKLTHREHVLKLPDTYLGSAAIEDAETWVLVHPPRAAPPEADAEAVAEADAEADADADAEAVAVAAMQVAEAEPQRPPARKQHEPAPRLERLAAQYNQALFKTFDEVLVNAHDHCVRTRATPSLRPVKRIDVHVDAALAALSVRNDGEGLDIVEHATHGVYVPELVFGHLLTSANYAEGEKRLVGGKNGYGAKLTNIFSRRFNVKTLDAGRGLKYEQRWRDNMAVCDPPAIKPAPSTAKPFVEVKWEPDLEKLGYAGTSASADVREDMVKVFEKRTWDLAATVPRDVKVFFNNQRIAIKSWADYAAMYLPPDEPLISCKIGERWEVALAASPAKRFLGISFVNGIPTTAGGTHVNAIVAQVTDTVQAAIKKARGAAAAAPAEAAVENTLAVFIKCLVENPTFASQTKEALKTRPRDFGSECALPESFLKKLLKLPIVPRLLEALEGKEAKAAKKSDGVKTTSVRVPKLVDAVLAGTRDSLRCTLILTEGDSAKTMALSGLSSVQRQTFGVFPLRGKLINPKEAAAARVHANAEVEALKKILGLKAGAEYRDASSLRYGSVLLMTDQDLDGSHIRGLLLNLFDGLWSSLLRVPGFLKYMATPIVRVAAGPEAGRSFFSLKEHRAWAAALEAGGAKLPRVKYYKGLGTSSAAEAQGYFAAPRTVPFAFTPACGDALALAFDPSQASRRKAWLTDAYDAEAEALTSGGALAISDFVRGDLVHFSHYNLQRAIPSVLDGLKVSQRKILFGCFKRRLFKEEIRVAQLAGYVSEHAAYHHGEASLCATITGMAQGFVGANNVPLLEALGQFGSRLSGGDDAASARYIYTRLSAAATKLFPAEDVAVLRYLKEEGEDIEPAAYAPILPLVLLNGADGIGTGFSTSVPSFRPSEVLQRVKARVSGEASAETPWNPLPFYAGFTGTIRADGADWHAEGVFARSALSALQVHVSELPVGTWTAPYLEFLDALVDKGTLLKYEDASTDTRVSLTLHFSPASPPPAEDAALQKLLKLTRKIGGGNMHLLDASGGVKRFDSASAILEAFLPHRLATYEARRGALIAAAEAALLKAREQAQFVDLIIQGKLKIMERSEAEFCAHLRDIDFVEIDGSFEYLLKMPMRSLTLETWEALLAEEGRMRLVAQRVRDTSAADMWLADLDALRAELERPPPQPERQEPQVTHAGKKRARSGNP